MPILRTFSTLPALCQLLLKNFILQKLFSPSLYHSASCCSRLPILRAFSTLPALCQLPWKNSILQELFSPSLPLCQLLFKITNHKNFQYTSRILSAAMEEFYPPRTLQSIATTSASCFSRIPILRTFGKLPAVCQLQLKNFILQELLCPSLPLCQLLFKNTTRTFSTIAALCQLLLKNSILKELFSPSLPLCQLLLKNSILKELFSPSLPLCQFFCLSLPHYQEYHLSRNFQSISITLPCCCCCCNDDSSLTDMSLVVFFDFSTPCLFRSLDETTLGYNVLLTMSPLPMCPTPSIDRGTAVPLHAPS